MLKDLFENRLFIGALAFFVLCVGGSLLYMQHVAQQGAEELAETQDRIAQWNEKQKPTTEGKAGDTSQGGHFHADGTWHGEPHEPPVEQPPTAQFREPSAAVQTQNASQVQQGSAQRMLSEDILSPEYIAMVKKAVQTSIDLFDKVHEDDSIEATFVNARNLVTEARGDAQHFRRLYYETGDETYLDKCYQIIALNHPYLDFVRSRSPIPKLNSEQLSQLCKAADEFDAIASQITVGPKPRNPYREQLQEEENR